VPPVDTSLVSESPRVRVGWLPWRRLRPDIGFGAFVSYSGPADRELISRLQRGIEKLANRWYRPPVMKVFVDKTSLGAGTRLWGRIEYGLSRSRWLIVMASPEAAQSWWVDREVGWWIAHRPLDNMIIVHTAGVLRWDRDTNDFSADSNAIPPCLRGKFSDEPVWSTVLRSGEGTDVEAAVLGITSAVRGTSVHELSSQAYREHRRTLRWAGGAIATLSFLLVAAVALSLVAVVQKRHADEEARVALSRQLASTSVTELSMNPRAALLLAASAYRVNPNPQTFAALMRADTANPQSVRYFDAGDTVAQLAASVDGKTLVAGLVDGRVIRWLLSDPSPVTVIQLSSPITSVALSADASVIAAADSHSAGLWRSGHDAVPLPLPSGLTVRAVAVSPSGNTAVIDGCFLQGQRCRRSSDVVVDAPTASQRVAYDGPSDYWTTEDFYLVASSDDDLLLFDSQGWERRHLANWALTESGELGLGAHQSNSKPSADGEVVAATNGATVVWKLHGQFPSASNILTVQSPITSSGNALALSPHGSALAIADAGSIYVAPVASENAVVAIPGATSPAIEAGAQIKAKTIQLPGAGIINSIDRLSFVGDDSRLVSATGRYIALWDLHQIDRLAKTTQTALNSGPCNACGPTQIRVSPDAKQAALVASSALAIEPLPGNSGSALNLPDLTGIALWRKDGRLLLVRGTENAKVSPQTAAGITAAEIQVFTDPGAERVAAAALDEAKRNVVAVGSSGTISILNADSGDLQDTIQGPKSVLANVSDDNPGTAISSAGDLVAVVTGAGSDSFQPTLQGSLWLYDVVNHRKIGSVPGDDITTVRFAGPLLLVQRAAGNLEFWDERGTTVRGVIGGDQRYVRPAAADPRGQVVARLRGENGIDLFDLSGTLVDSIPEYPNSFRTGYAFSADGTVFVTDISTGYGAPSVDDILLVRDLSPEALLQSACTAAGGNLSAKEWQTLAGIAPAGIPTC
jgi:WD40 repeat protein